MKYLFIIKNLNEGVIINKHLLCKLGLGVASLMLVAPLMGSGVHADSQTMNAPMTQTTGTSNTGSTASSSNNQSAGNSGQLASIKAQIQAQESSMQTTLQQAQQKYKSIPKNQKSQQKALEAQYTKQQKPAQKKLAALQKKYVDTMTPKQRKQAQDQQKAAQKKMMQQLQKSFKAQQKKEIAQMMKTAQPLFLVKGHYVYKMMADLNKKGGAIPVPNTMKKYMPIRKFANFDRKEQFKARAMYQNARHIKNKATRKQQMQKANQLFMEFIRIAHINTPKKSTNKKVNKKSHRNARKTTRRKSTKLRNRTRRSNKRGRKAKHNRIRRSNKRSHKIKRNRTRVRRTKRGSFTAKEGSNNVTYLNSKYRRGNLKAARRTGFANGSIFSKGQVHTMFDRYAPNSRRAVIPRNYRIYRFNINGSKNQPATVWLVGRRTNNVKKLNHMRKAYYYRYNKRYGGWANIGFNG